MPNICLNNNAELLKHNIQKGTYSKWLNVFWIIERIWPTKPLLLLNISGIDYDQDNLAV